MQAPVEPNVFGNADDKLVVSYDSNGAGHDNAVYADL